MYLREYENRIFNSPTDIKPFIMPSNENKSKLFSPTDITEFKLCIKLEKLISSPTTLFPISCILPEIK